MYLLANSSRADFSFITQSLIIFLKSSFKSFAKIRRSIRGNCFILDTLLKILLKCFDFSGFGFGLRIVFFSCFFLIFFISAINFCFFLYFEYSFLSFCWLSLLIIFNSAMERFLKSVVILLYNYLILFL